MSQCDTCSKALLDGLGDIRGCHVGMDIRKNKIDALLDHCQFYDKYHEPDWYRNQPDHLSDDHQELIRLLRAQTPVVVWYGTERKQHLWGTTNLSRYTDEELLSICKQRNVYFVSPEIH